MNIKWRLAGKLAGGLLAVGLVLLVASTFILYWTSTNMSRMEAARQFESEGLHLLVQTLQKDDGRIRFDPKLLEMVRDNGGWLQRIDGDGNVIDGYLVPPDVPSTYGPGELTAYWLGRTPFPYELYLWIQEKDGLTHTLLYGKRNESSRLLEQLAESAVIGADGTIKLSPSHEARLREDRSWLQLLDEKGNQIASFDAPEAAQSQYSLQELALRSVYADRFGAWLMSRYEPDTGLTWLLSTPYGSLQPGEQPFMDPELAILAAATGALIGSSMVIFVLFAWWFGQRSGAPILHMMNWIKVLGGGRYAEPSDKDGKPRSIGKDGKRKRNYRIFGDVMESLETLSDTLKRDAKVREETEKARDEWIAGVSHDLKTPLSSIKGYAHMLENPGYEWSAEEVRSFARVMLDKSGHLEHLIGDLTLAYQLRSGSSPPSMDEVELNGYLPETLYGAGISPDNQAAKIAFRPAEHPVYVKVYKPWFQRVVDNLTANAFLHNPANTALTVTVSAIGPEEVSIVFADNGEGMDEQTQRRLFDRYYRGTDTESATEGSGLGMAVAKALVEAQYGTIGVSSIKGEGTEITLKWKSRRE